VRSPASRAARGERTREAILESAVKLFAERGYYGVTLDEITAMAETKKSLMLYYYKSKLDLWRSAADFAARNFDQALRSRLARGSSHDIRHHVTSWLDAFLAEPDLARMLVFEGGRPSDRLEWLVQHFSHSELSFLSPGLRKLLSVTVLRDALMAIFLSMSALGPLMESSLAKVTGQVNCGVYPMSRARRKELIQLIVDITQSLEAKIQLRA
jgi:AcrR family transcriptional regulator